MNNPTVYKKEIFINSLKFLRYKIHDRNYPGGFGVSYLNQRRS